MPPKRDRLQSTDSLIWRTNDTYPGLCPSGVLRHSLSSQPKERTVRMNMHIQDYPPNQVQVGSRLPLLSYCLEGKTPTTTTFPPALPQVFRYSCPEEGQNRKSSLAGSGFLRHWNQKVSKLSPWHSSLEQTTLTVHHWTQLHFMNKSPWMRWQSLTHTHTGTPPKT